MCQAPKIIKDNCLNRMIYEISQTLKRNKIFQILDLFLMRVSLCLLFYVYANFCMAIM